MATSLCRSGKGPAPSCSLGLTFSPDSQAQRGVTLTGSDEGGLRTAREAGLTEPRAGRPRQQRATHGNEPSRMATSLSRSERPCPELIA